MRSSFRNGIWLQTEGLSRSMTDGYLLVNCVTLGTEYQLFPFQIISNQKKSHSNNMHSMWPRGFVFVAFWKPCFLDGLLCVWGSSTTQKLLFEEGAEGGGGGGRGGTSDKFSSLFVPKLRTITITTKVVDRPSLSSWCCTLICSVLGRRKPHLFQLREEENLICSVLGRRKPHLSQLQEEESLICLSCGKKKT